MTLCTAFASPWLPSGTLRLLRLSHPRIWLSRFFALRPRGGTPDGDHSVTIASRTPSSIGRAFRPLFNIELGRPVSLARSACIPMIALCHAVLRASVVITGRLDTSGVGSSWSRLSSSASGSLGFESGGQPLGSPGIDIVHRTRTAGRGRGDASAVAVKHSATAGRPASPRLRDMMENGALQVPMHSPNATIAGRSGCSSVVMIRQCGPGVDHGFTAVKNVN